MDIERGLIGAVEPDQWFLAFYTETTSPRFDRLIPGRFKHVSAFAYVLGLDVWLYFDVNFVGLTLMVLSHERMGAELPRLTRNATVVRIVKRREPMNLACRWGFYCVPAVKHLLGIRCVELTPTGLYRYVLRNGGIPVAANAASPAGPDAPIRASAG